MLGRLALDQTAPGIRSYQGCWLSHRLDRSTGVTPAGRPLGAGIASENNPRRTHADDVPVSAPTPNRSHPPDVVLTFPVDTIPELTGVEKPEAEADVRSIDLVIRYSVTAIRSTCSASLPGRTRHMWSPRPPPTPASDFPGFKL